MANPRLDNLAPLLAVTIRQLFKADPLDDVRAAFTELEAGHIAGKIVLIP